MIKNKTKSFLIILITLIIGIAIGFEISEILIKKRFDEFREIRAPRGFVEIFDNIIKPDNQQKPIIDSILLKFHKETEKIMSVGRIQMNKQLDSLRIKLKQYLNKEQLERFDVEIDRIKRGHPPQSMPKGPPYKQRRNGPPPDFGGKNLPPPPPQER